MVNEVGDEIHAEPTFEDVCHFVPFFDDVAVKFSAFGRRGDVGVFAFGRAGDDAAFFEFFNHSRNGRRREQDFFTDFCRLNIRFFVHRHYQVSV